MLGNLKTQLHDSSISTTGDKVNISLTNGDVYHFLSSVCYIDASGRSFSAKWHVANSGGGTILCLSVNVQAGGGGGVGYNHQLVGHLAGASESLRFSVSEISAAAMVEASCSYTEHAP